MEKAKQKTEIEWENIKIEIAYEPNKHGNVSHIEVKAKERLPITETGYRSIFESEEFIQKFESVEAYVKSQLNEAMKSKEWKLYLKEKNQLKLF